MEFWHGFLLITSVHLLAAAIVTATPAAPAALNALTFANGIPWNEQADSLLHAAAWRAGH